MNGEREGRENEKSNVANCKNLLNLSEGSLSIILVTSVILKLKINIKTNK